MTLTEEGLPHVSTLTDDLLLELHGKGLPAREIARRYEGGVHTTISRRLDRLKAAHTGGGAVEVPLTWIEDNPWQPRGPLVEEDIKDLAASIAKHGQLEAVRGRPIGPERVELVYGHRRVAALRRLVARGEWSGGVRCEVVPGLTDAQMVYESLAENTDRKDLSELEQARAWRHILDSLQISVSQLAEQLRKDRSTISNALRILKLPDAILARVESGEVPFRAARELLCLQDPFHCHLEDMKQVIEAVNGRGKGNWKVDIVRAEIRLRATHFPDNWRPLDPADNDVNYLEYNLAQALPLFEVEPWLESGHYPVHNIPCAKGDKSRRWTCAVKDWQRSQQKAVDALVPPARSAAAPASGPVSPETPAPSVLPAAAPPAALDLEQPDLRPGTKVLAGRDLADDQDRPLALDLTVGMGLDLLPILCDVWRKAPPESHERQVVDRFLAILEGKLGEDAMLERAPERENPSP